MGLCKNCKFWHPNTPDFDQDSDMDGIVSLDDERVWWGCQNERCAELLSDNICSRADFGVFFEKVVS
jgi:hypothetical protein